MKQSNNHNNVLSAFNVNIKLIWQKIGFTYDPLNTKPFYKCDKNKFYLNIPNVGKFLVLLEENCIIIDKAHSDITIDILNTWLQGTIIAYILQYHGYLVLHGSAVLINDKAVIFSGQSGAGKSTLACALMQKGYQLITDDLVVIKRNKLGKYSILPGPAHTKLWKDSINYLNHDINRAIPIMLKSNKYVIKVPASCDIPSIPIHSFYELNIAPDALETNCERLNPISSLQTLIQNVYRYFMLKPLGRLELFFNDCSALSQQIAIFNLTRTSNFQNLSDMISFVELNQSDFS